MGPLPGLRWGQEDVDRVSGDTRQDALRTRAPVLCRAMHVVRNDLLLGVSCTTVSVEDPVWGPDWGRSWDLAKELQTTPVPA